VIKSVFYYSSITQFMPSYQSHTLIILVWNKVTSDTFQARILLCKIWHKLKMSSPRQIVMRADVVWNKLFLIIAHILCPCSYVNVNCYSDNYNTCTCNTNTVGITWSLDVH
jgi:hypothetical protein